MPDRIGSNGSALGQNDIDPVLQRVDVYPPSIAVHADQAAHAVDELLKGRVDVPGHSQCIDGFRKIPGHIKAWLYFLYVVELPARVQGEEVVVSWIKTYAHYRDDASFLRHGVQLKLLLNCSTIGSYVAVVRARGDRPMKGRE